MRPTPGRCSGNSIAKNGSDVNFRLASVFVLLALPFAAQGQGYTIAPEENPDVAPLIAEIGRMSDSLDTPAYQEWLFEQGREYERGNEVKRAWYCFEAYRTVTRRMALVDFAVSAESGRRESRTKVADKLKHIQAFAVRHSRRFPFFGALACDVELFSKSLLLNSARETRRRIMEAGDPETRAKWNELSEFQNQAAYMRAYIRQAETDSSFMAALRLADTVPDPGLRREIGKFNALKRQADSLEKFLHAQERRMVLESTARGDFRIETDFTAEWTDVRDALAEGEAVVEFFTYPGPDGERHYAALIVCPRTKYPHLVSIGPESRITAAMKGRFDFDGLWFEVWRPLEYHLGYARNVYIAPAGILNAVPFAALHNLGEFIADRYTLHNILSGKDIIAGRHRPEPLTPGDAVLFGGADFSFAEAVPGSVPTVGEEREELACGLRSVRGQGFDYLPGSLKEVGAIAGILRKNGWNTSVFADTAATESRFRTAVGNRPPRILHISTHGFHIPEPASGPGPEGRNLFKVSDNPLMRSGLLFAGANRVWNGGDMPDPAADGILTALEIARMELSGTKLVVLSACETGLGMIDNSEGVYGLQRAFRLAGAEAMIVGLWKVPDGETARMMTEFYRGIAAGKSAKKAFDLAQREARRRNPYDPYKWAGFIFIE